MILGLNIGKENKAHFRTELDVNSRESDLMQFEVRTVQQTQSKEGQSEAVDVNRWIVWLRVFSLEPMYGLRQDK